MKLPRNRFVIALLLSTFVVIWGVARLKDTAHRIATEEEEEGGLEGEQRLDSIFVLMGGQTENAGVPVWVQRRLDRAVELQKERRTKDGGVPPIVSLGAGTPTKRPHLTADKFIWFESNSASAYLNETRHVDFKLLLKECTSYDTRGNGYFSLIQFAIPAGWRHIAIITSEFHMARSKAIFEWIYGMPGAGAGHGYHPAENRVLLGSNGQGFALEYHSVSDEDLGASALKYRASAEAAMFQRVIALSERIKTLPELHDYIYVESKQYNTAKLKDFGKESTDPRFTSDGLY